MNLILLHIGHTNVGLTGWGILVLFAVLSSIEEIGRREIGRRSR